MAKFVIEKIENENIIIEVNSLELEVILTSDCEQNANNQVLCFSLDSFEKLKNHIGWAKETDANQVEQGGILAGKILKDFTTNRLWGIVENIIPAYHAEGTMKHLSFNHSTWIEMMQELDKTELSLIGWYHTHPKHLRVYMSNTDLQTQETFFYKDWHFSVILNPQKEIWRVFYGKQGKECKGIVFQKIFIQSFT